jgi:hypothetical protein
MANRKVVIIVSNFTTNTSDDCEYREIPELNKLFEDGWEIDSITPVVNQGSTNSSYLGSMQLIVRLSKQQ